MTNQERFYGNLLRIDIDGDSTPEVLRRVPLGADVLSGGVDEATLQDLLFRFPGVLPIAAIDPSFDRAVPICRELHLPSGNADALYANNIGRLTLVEFKLWRNPQARREVIGQILDYAKDLASLDYQDLQQRISHETGTDGNALYDLVRKQSPDLHEAEFVDNVTRTLRRGEFLMLIIGDGIQENAAGLIDFVQAYSGLHFHLAMVEAALYRDGMDRLIIQPRVLARTEIVQRFVITGERVAHVAVAPTTGEETERRGQDPYEDFYRPLIDQLAEEGILRIPRGRRGGWWGRYRAFYAGHNELWYGVIIEEDNSISVFLRNGIDKHRLLYDELQKLSTEIERDMPGFGVLWWPYDNVSNMGVVIHLESSLAANDSTEQSDAVREQVFQSLVSLRNAVQPRLDVIMGEIELTETNK